MHVSQSSTRKVFIEVPKNLSRYKSESNFVRPSKELYRMLNRFLECQDFLQRCLTYLMFLRSYCDLIKYKSENNFDDPIKLFSYLYLFKFLLQQNFLSIRRFNETLFSCKNDYFADHHLWVSLFFRDFFRLWRVSQWKFKWYLKRQSIQLNNSVRNARCSPFSSPPMPWAA